jgi:hypothetical protein
MKKFYLGIQSYRGFEVLIVTPMCKKGWLTARQQSGITPTALTKEELAKWLVKVAKENEWGLQSKMFRYQAFELKT